jgi:hypothetical protein
MYARKSYRTDAERRGLVSGHAFVTVSSPAPDWHSHRQQRTINSNDTFYGAVLTMI